MTDNGAENRLYFEFATEPEQRIKDLTAYLKQFDASGQKAASAKRGITVAGH